MQRITIVLSFLTCPKITAESSVVSFKKILITEMPKVVFFMYYYHLLFIFVILNIAGKESDDRQ
jgi:hypothetical protein